MEDFMEVTLGNQEIKADGKTAGYTENTGVSVNIQYKNFDYGTPKKRIGKSPIQMEVGLKATLKEITPLNFLLAMGIKDNVLKNLLGAAVSTFWKVITEWDGEHTYTSGDYVEPTVLNGYCYEATAVTGDTGATEPIWPTTAGNTVVDGGVTWTCRAYPAEEQIAATYDSDMIYAKTDHPALTTGLTPVVYNADFTEKITADYQVDKLTGVFQFFPGSDVDDGDTINILYQYTPLNQQYVEINPDAFLLAYADISSMHRKPTDGKYIGFDGFKMQSNNAPMSFNPVDYSGMEVNWKSFYDPDRGDYACGRLTWYN